MVSLHPHYSFSYAPGVILSVDSDLWVQVRLYDGSQVRLPREEVYHLKQQKFERDVQYILMLEDQWVGKAVVYRNKDTGTYQLGKEA